jgi:hypothetical protein
VTFPTQEVPIGTVPPSGQTGWTVCGVCHSIVSMRLPDGTEVGSIKDHAAWHIADWQQGEKL